MAVKTNFLDTNAYAAIKQGRPEAKEIIQRAPRLALCSIVLGELWGGFAFGSRDEQNRIELQAFLASERVQVVPVNEGTAEVYAAIYRQLRLKGNPIPTNDMWIAAGAVQYGFALYSYDKHFRQIEGLVVGHNHGRAFALDCPRPHTPR
jgi:tRNA(fMet)-specific endonuclease VapC